jgi:hypothetical protein
LFDGGPEATQNGLGDLMPARLVERSAIMQGRYSSYMDYMGYNWDGWDNESRAVPIYVTQATM